MSKLRLRAAGMISHTFFRFVQNLSPIELFRASNRADLFWQDKCTICRYDDACITVLNRQPNDTIPYKFLPHALDSVKQVVSTEEKRMSTHKKAQSLVVQDDKLTHQADPPYEPTLEEIRARAYEAYIQRGRIDGLDLEDWLQAERELRENGHQRVDS